MDKKITIYHGSEHIIETPEARDSEANQLYMKMTDSDYDGLYIRDIIRGGIQNDDPRLPRNVSE